MAAQARTAMSVQNLPVVADHGYFSEEILEFRMTPLFR